MSTVAFLRAASSTRRAFRNWLAIGFAAGFALPSALPPRRGIARLGRRRLAFRTRLGPVLETEIANASPIIEVFRDEPYGIPIDWPALGTVFDLGSHVGAFAIWAAHRAPNARVLAFEPEPANARDLRANVARNGLSDRIEVLETAIGASEGQRVLHVAADRDTASLWPDSPGHRTLVACARLERFLDDRKVDLLKVDCEGAEHEILDSLTPSGWARVERIVLEAHARNQAEIDSLARRLDDAGFRVTPLAGGHATSTFPVVRMVWAERR